uniref:Ground-like domain-containing protein n=1 Tax=Caenorhabditis japonica TaxID=281687 RepID=A0A8R1DMN8_CAEJA
MNSSILLALFTFSALFTISTGCGIGVFPSMSGGGCGCGGGGMPPPPPPSCGCMGGRKKRSVPQDQTVHGTTNDESDTSCNTPELKKIILENMHTVATDSSKAINSELEARRLHRFVVVCAENSFAFTTKPNTVYCGAEKNGHKCHAFSL